ncbi:hypothetical protein GGR58DRAFT_472423 [Xylaria digitata]|nr:hypothetical protein GGR58DRAFT_472423 [Xylaria digitata]
MRVITSVAVLALAFLGQADAGLVKAPRTETPALLSGHVFVEPIPTPTPATTTVLPAISTATSTPGEIPSDIGTVPAQASNPEITAAPPLEPGDGQKFIQTTYWACATLGLETHCGWHEPILDVSSAGTRVSGGSGALMGGVAACVAAALVLVL